MPAATTAPIYGPLRNMCTVDNIFMWMLCFNRYVAATATLRAPACWPMPTQSSSWHSNSKGMAGGVQGIQATGGSYTQPELGHS